MRQYTAFDQTIEVEVRAFPVVWWLLVGFEVRINGQVFHPRLDRAGFFAHPVTEFYMVGDGRLVSGMVRGIGHWYTFRKKRYSLVVGMAELAREAQPVRGWPLSLLAAGVVWAILGFATLGVASLVLLAKGRFFPP